MLFCYCKCSAKRINDFVNVLKSTCQLYVGNYDAKLSELNKDDMAKCCYLRENILIPVILAMEHEITKLCGFQRLNTFPLHKFFSFHIKKFDDKEEDIGTILPGKLWISTLLSSKASNKETNINNPETCIQVYFVSDMFKLYLRQAIQSDRLCDTGSTIFSKDIIRTKDNLKLKNGYLVLVDELKKQFYEMIIF